MHAAREKLKAEEEKEEDEDSDDDPSKEEEELSDEKSEVKLSSDESKSNITAEDVQLTAEDRGPCAWQSSLAVLRAHGTNAAVQHLAGRLRNVRKK
jgi:hypothetical protein